MTQSKPMTAAVTDTAARAVGWQVWVPCVGMALCSWLSFVDRQVLNILAPTIIKDTGLTNQDFTAATSFFFLTYTLGNPVWGTVIDYIGLRKGMLLAVAVWTVASMSHSWMASFAGFALARAVLGVGEGGTFPGGLRTAVETLPPVMRARGIALSFSGGTIGAVMMPLLLGPLAISYGWRNAFLATGLLGVIWMVIWAAIARPPFLPATSARPHKAMWPNFGERRVWALIFSYALPAISPGPVLTILALYLGQGLGMTQAQVNGVVWVPPLTWGIGYFFWGWAADKFAATNTRPIGLFLLLTVASLTLGFATWTTSPAIAIALISFSTFIGGGFQMLSERIFDSSTRLEGLTNDGVRMGPISCRLISPAEMDLMARIAGLRLLARWGGWHHEPFTADSKRHVSVYGR